MVQAGVGTLLFCRNDICQRLAAATLRWLPLESDPRWQLGT